MAYQEVGGQRTFIKLEDYVPEDGERKTIVEGKYLGSYTDRTYGGLRYEIEDADGVVFVMPKSGALDRKMERCEVGDMLKFVHAGKEKLGAKHKFAGKFFHNVLVFKASEGTQEVEGEEADSEDLF